VKVSVDKKEVGPLGGKRAPISEDELSSFSRKSDLSPMRVGDSVGGQTRLSAGGSLLTLNQGHALESGKSHICEGDSCQINGTNVP
jgi:hypothetical protein